MKKLYIEYNKDTNTPLTPKKQAKGPVLCSTYLVKATEEDIAKAEEYYKLNSECHTHLVYDKMNYAFGYHAIFCGDGGGGTGHGPYDVYPDAWQVICSPVNDLSVQIKFHQETNCFAFTIKEVQILTETIIPSNWIDKDSYLETYYEIVSAFHTNPNSKVLEEIESTAGRGGMYDFAKQLTDEFEAINKDRSWDGDFFDELEEFLKDKL